MAVFVAMGVVVTQFLRFEGFAPMAHFMNVIVGVLTGPLYCFVFALSVAILRMLIIGIPPLALTGAIVGAAMVPWFYRLSGRKLIFAPIGEVIGTGIIGSLLSYPVMAFIMGKGGLSLFYYTPSFLIATVAGGGLGYAFLKILERTGQLKRLQQMLK